MRRRSARRSCASAVAASWKPFKLLPRALPESVEASGGKHGKLRGRLKGFPVLTAFAGGEYARNCFLGVPLSMPSVSRFASSIASLVIAMTLSLGYRAQAAPAEREPVRIEVFTAQDLAIQPLEPGDLSASTTIEVYKVDETERFETILSEQLPPDPEVAKCLAQERLRQLGGSQIEEAKRAAAGIVKAAEYGIERYPAIVFDGEAVVYGVTDIGEALRLYRARRGRVLR